MITFYDLKSEHLATEGINELITAGKHAEDLIRTEHEKRMTTQSLETECTTEIDLQTPEDKTPVASTATTYKEKQSKPVDFISENIESKGTNEPATPTTSIKYAEDFISTTQETLLTTETLETECTTEIELQTPEDKTPVTTTATTYEEKQSEERKEIKPTMAVPGVETQTPPSKETEALSHTDEDGCFGLIHRTSSGLKRCQEKNMITFYDLKSEHLATEGVNELITAGKHAEDLIRTEHEKRMTTQSLETECTTEIEFYTPEDKTPVTTTATTYEEKQSKPVDFISENIESKGTNEPATPTTSIKYAEDFISTTQETLLTTETLETECTTEIDLQTPEDKTPVASTATTYKEKQSKPVDFISENIESKGTNEPATPTTSIKYAEDFISTTQETLLTTETLETECTTEIDLQTPEDKTPVTSTATTYEEKTSKPVDFISENIKSKGTNEPATPSTFREHYVRPTEHEMALVFPDIECTTESKSSTEKPEDILKKQSEERKEMKPTMAVPGVETQTPPSKETEMSWRIDEDGCFGLIHRTSSGLKRCQEKIIEIDNLKSEHLATEGVNELITAGKHAEGLLKTEHEKRMTTETLETECTTEIELQTPEDKTPVTTTTTTYEEKQSKPVDFISENTESKGTNEPATPTTSIKYAEDFISTREVTLMTTETLETECTTEIDLQTPEDKTPVTTTATTY